MVHESVEFPPLYENEVTLAESVHVGEAGGGNIMIGGAGGGGGGGSGGGGSVQHGGPSCACATFGVPAPATNAITTPSRIVATMETTPIRIGFFCIYIDIVFFIF